MVSNAKSDVVLDIGHSHIKAIFGKTTGNTGSASDFFVLHTHSTPTRGFSKKGIHNQKRFQDSLEEAVHQLSKQVGRELHKAHIIFSSPSHKHIKKRKRITIPENSAGIIVRESWLQKKKTDIVTELKKKYPRNICTSIEAIEIFADAEDITHDYEDYTALTNLEITFSCILTPAVFFETLKHTVSSVVEIESAVSTLRTVKSLLTEDQKEMGAVICDIGAKTTNVAIYKDGLIQKTDLIQFGGDSITAALALTKKISIEQAETLKQTLETTDRNLSTQDVRAVEKTIIAFAKESLLPLLKEVDASKEFAYGIILTGGGSLYPQLSEILTKGTGVYTSLLPRDKRYKSEFTLAFARLADATKRKEKNFVLEYSDERSFGVAIIHSVWRWFIHLISRT